uniref:Uncharacterized protein n=1 Tax=Helianthus annuus TaxID=4232 RepID=A0A251UJ68_HELAN
MPHGIFLANHFNDVDILLIKRIHIWAPNSFPLFSFISFSHKRLLKHAFHSYHSKTLIII